jgi:tetratricopeptide (TPR) repeat protein
MFTAPMSQTDGSVQSARWPLAALAVGVIAVGAYSVSARPSPQPLAAVSEIVSALENSRRMADAERVRSACAGEAGAGCECRQEAAHRALDKNLLALARTVLAGDPACEAQPTSRGLLAELLARSDRSADAMAIANDVLEMQPAERFSAYALAHASFADGDAAGASAHGRRAAELGRGAPAHLLLAMIAQRAGDLGAARVELEKVLLDDPEHVDALYELAVIAARQNRYRDARQGYLRVLELAPRRLDARYDLARITHSAGASAEARHHLEKLEAIADHGDPRVEDLRRRLAKDGR